MQVRPLLAHAEALYTHQPARIRRCYGMITQPYIATDSQLTLDRLLHSDPLKMTDVVASCSSSRNIAASTR